jgi:hypothetical protein
MPEPRPVPPWAQTNPEPLITEHGLRKAADHAEGKHEAFVVGCAVCEAEECGQNA